MSSSEDEKEKFKTILDNPDLLSFFKLGRGEEENKANFYSRNCSCKNVYVEDSEVGLSLSTQHFLNKKMSEAIERSVEFVPVSSISNFNHIFSNYDLQLLSDVKIRLRSNESNINVPIKKVLPVTKKQSNKELDKRKKSREIHKIAVDGKDIISGDLTKAWAKKTFRKLYCYKKGENGKAYCLNENEFSTLRIKNNWTESKISKKNISYIKENKTLGTL